MANKDVLAAFLAADKNVKEKVELKRLGVEVEVKGLDQKEMAQLNERATFGDKVDEQKLNALIIVKGCTNIDFGNDKMLEHYGALDTVDCVGKALLAGEVVKLVQAILKASGFDDFAEQIKAAKN